MPAIASKDWLKHTKAHPCPICRKPDRCKYTENGAHLCFRTSEAPQGWYRVKLCKGGTGGIFREGAMPERNKIARRRNESAARPEKNDLIGPAWAVKCDEFRAALSDADLQSLAAALGVSARALSRIGCGRANEDDLRSLEVHGQGWSGNYPATAFSFPERDAAGTIIGLSFRATDGRKGAAKGCQRGLTIPEGWATQQGSVLVVEGASDVAAALSIGLKAVGRPSNTGGSALLSTLLKGQPVLVLGENDERLVEDGKTQWPGRDGALAIARSLAAAWQVPVRVAMPPKGEKDLRSWLGSLRIDLDDPAACNAAGTWVRTALETGAETVEPAPPAVTFQIKWKSNRSSANVVASIDGAAIHADHFKPMSEQRRRLFVEQLVARDPRLKEAELDSLLLKAALDECEPEPTAAGELSRDVLLAGFDDEIDDFLDRLPADAISDAEAMLVNPGLINEILADIRATNVVGESELALTTFVVGVSRLLERPLSAITQGPSSSGKSFVNERVSRLFPELALLRCTDMTPQALFYLPPGRLIHRWVVGGERSRKEDDDRAEATRALREMISSGTLSKAVTMKIGGRMETVVIRQDGPIAFTETTTLATIFDEDANRCLLLGTDESAEQTRRINSAAAHIASGATSHNPTVTTRHHALQCLLKRVNVIVPFAERLATAIPNDRPEARRAFPQTIRTIQSVALLHQRQRGHAQPRHGDTISATVDDYLVARRLLLGPMARALGGALPAATTNLAKRVAERYGGDQFTTTQALADDKIVKSRSKMTEHLNTLNTAGVVELVEQGKGQRPSIWKVIGDPPPPGAMWLPNLSSLGVT